MTATTKFAIGVARRTAGIPDNMSSDDALAQGLITPEQLEALMAIITDILMGCFDNNREMARRRMKAYTDQTDEMKRLGDNIALNRRTNQWLDRLAIPRQTGDVVAVRRALAAEAAALKDEEFNTIHAEALFLAI